MSHKVHPKICRIGITTDWSSRWMLKDKLQNYLEEDFCIRKILKDKFKNTGIETIEIERFPGKINIIIPCSRPGLIIGRGGTGINEIKREIESKLVFLKKNALKRISTEPQVLNIEIREIKNPWIFAGLSGQWIASQIEKRMPFRKVLKQALTKIMENKEVKGAKIAVSGRLDGAEIARDEWLKKGSLPRQTLRADISFALTEAKCTYGIIGIKVWIYKGEKFVEKTNKEEK